MSTGNAEEFGIRPISDPGWARHADTPSEPVAQEAYTAFSGFKAKSA
jgi:hypothetical protein